MKDCSSDAEFKGIGFFERYLTVWVILCIVAGIALGKIAPGVAKSLDAMAIYVGDAPVVSIPIALCLFFFWASLPVPQWYLYGVPWRGAMTAMPW